MHLLLPKLLAKVEGCINLSSDQLIMNSPSSTPLGVAVQCNVCHGIPFALVVEQEWQSNPLAKGCHLCSGNAHSEKAKAPTVATAMEA